MEINTEASQLTLLNSLLTTGAGTADSSSSSGISSTFGPASIVSIGTSTTNDDNTYSKLAAQAGIQFDLTGILMAQQAAQAAPNSQQLSDAEKEALEEAFSLIESNELDEAEAVLDDLLSRSETNGAAIHALGLIEVERDNLSKAEKLFRRADYLAPGRGYADDAENARILNLDDEDVLEEASKLVQDPDTRRRGLALLLRLTEKQPNDAESRILLAETLLADGNLIDGLDQLFGAIDVADNAQLRRIEDTAEELIEILPNMPQLHRLLGKAQVELGDFEDAIVTLGTAADLADSNAFVKSDLALAYVGIGRELLEKGDVSRAVVSFEQAKTLDSTGTEVREALAEGYLARGNQYMRYGGLDQAVQEFYSASRQLNNSSPEHLRKLIAGGTYVAGLRLERESIALGRDLDTEALAFQAAYDLQPDNVVYKRKLAETRNTLGDQFLADDDYEQAVAAYRRALDLYPNDDNYEDNLINASVLLGDELLSENDYDGAILAYREAYELDIENDTNKTKLAETYNTGGLDYKGKSQYAKAAADFKEALRLYPDNSTYQANYDTVSMYDT